MERSDFIDTPGERLARELERQTKLRSREDLEEIKQALLEIKLDEARKATQAPQETELDDATDLEAALADLAADLTAHYNSFDPEQLNSCTLLGPEQLTVEVTGRGYKKVAHMGGEDFIPNSAYVGKRGKIIVVFRPVGAASYQTMEMAADDAVSNLSAFEALSITEGGDYKTRMKAISLKAVKLKEREAVKDKAEDYPDFGSF